MFGEVLAGGVVFFSILYYIVREAIQDGVLSALLKYESMKNQHTESVDNEP